MTSDDQVKALLTRVASTRKSAKFKAVLPFIAGQLSLGAQQQDIVEVLNRCGLNISLKTFYIYLFRVRQSGEFDRVLATATPPSNVLPGSVTGDLLPVTQNSAVLGDPSPLLDRVTQSSIPEGHSRPANIGATQAPKGPLLPHEVSELMNRKVDMQALREAGLASLARKRKKLE